MTRTVVFGEDEAYLAVTVERFRAARCAVALTGAGVSVESGIPDFRSPGGLWTRFPPETYATLEAFRSHPERAWELYRAMGRMLEGKAPNPAHRALAELEAAGRLAGVITQNVDGLHQAAGSRKVVEIHGDHRRLQCLACARLEPVREEYLAPGPMPRCPSCGAPLKPNVVLFGEAVRGMEYVDALLDRCDLLLVAGTSARVHPASGLPAAVKWKGGCVYEFNREPTVLSDGSDAGDPFTLLARPLNGGVSDYLFLGPVGETLPCFADRVLRD